MRFDTLLNLLWLLLGAFALLATLRTHEKRVGLQIIGVALVIAALFPFISASDDLLRIQQAKEHSGANDHLVRLYTNMETLVVISEPKLNFVSCFVLLIEPTPTKSIERDTPTRLGRSPPALRSA